VLDLVADLANCPGEPEAWEDRKMGRVKEQLVEGFEI
jgi:hypothetical protein